MLLYLALRHSSSSLANNLSSSFFDVTPDLLTQAVLHEASPLNGLPAPVLALLALGCLALAAAVAGLTLGLMSLDSTALDIVMKSKDPNQAAAARVIKPIREQGNLLLVTLLLSNTLAAESLPLILEALVPGGVFSLVASVLSLMLFGEMIPQAVCSRHPLYFGARLIGFVKVLRFILYPIAAPIAYALDILLGEELGTMYTRDELKNLIDVHAQSKVLTYDETVILKGTLEFTGKAVESIMTPLENVFMLDIDAKLDRDTMIEILKHGHSRVPLYDTSKNNIVCLLLVKQLIMVNPYEVEPTQIRRLISNVQTNHKVRVAPTWECSRTTRISDLLNSFQLGRSHLAMVYDDASKPVDQRAVVGIVTMEDIIEEILQEEIVDETDLYIDNTNQQLRLVQDSAGRTIFSPPPIPSPTSSIVQSSDEVVRDPVHLQEIDFYALRRPINDDRPTTAGAGPSSVIRMNDEPRFHHKNNKSRDAHTSEPDSDASLSSPRRTRQQQNQYPTSYSTPSSSPNIVLSNPNAPADSYGNDLSDEYLSEPALDRRFRREMSRQESANRKRREQHFSNNDSPGPTHRSQVVTSATHGEESSLMKSHRSLDNNDHSHHHHARHHQQHNGSDFDTDIEDAARSVDNSVKGGGSDSDVERSTLLMRNSADNLTGEKGNAGVYAVTKLAARGKLMRRSSRLGPLLGGIHPHSMMSLMDDDNNVMPEDVARAEHQQYYVVCKTPRGDLPSTETIMRPVPEYASSARAEIPNRHHRRLSLSVGTRRSDINIVAAVASPSSSKRSHPRILANSYGSVDYPHHIAVNLGERTEHELGQEQEEIMPVVKAKEGVGEIDFN